MASVPITWEPSPYNGQPAIPYLHCPCGRVLSARLGVVTCPGCGIVYSGDGDVLRTDDCCQACSHPRTNHERVVLSSVEAYDAACTYGFCVCAQFTEVGA